MRKVNGEVAKVSVMFSVVDRDEVIASRDIAVSIERAERFVIDVNLFDGFRLCRGMNAYEMPVFFIVSA